MSQWRKNQRPHEPPGALTWGHSCSRKMDTSECQPETVGCDRQLTAAVLAVSFVVGVLGNGLVLSMTLFRMARAVPVVCFFNLAPADFTLLLSLPIAINHVASGKWLLGTLACKCYLAFLVLTFVTSIWLLGLISVDRCTSVLYPEWARNHRTAPRAVWLAGGVWLPAAATCSPHLIFRTGGPGKVASGETGGGDRHLLPAGAAGDHRRLRLRLPHPRHARRPKRSPLVLVSAFFTSSFPFNVMLLVQMGRLMDPTEPPYPRMLLLLWATFSLGCFHSSLSPFLYVFIGRDLQEKFFQSLPSALARAFGEEGVSQSSCPPSEAPRG
ncbi:PREDICTED: LOW QUALITY PROTEIN: probable G-protein coupled receptor 32 [Propithecus coquereli]|uniref:LOW QUALITY PROTEIN: probable G-protein coupled receptor 32 n=1 Tax=Propithecus coquereli TaxID=379532 RepID=UPI00063F8ED6|nr:PREDICTED: LOW QUALITY PROTEIN: probable G-protein coupled receptor 32 [Propithecus coquereli]